MAKSYNFKLKITKFLYTVPWGLALAYSFHSYVCV